MNGLNYLLQTNLYLVLFMGFYVLVLRNETFFRHNRIYLNASVLLSFAIPFINSPWFRDLFITQKVREVFVPSDLIYETIVVGVNEEATNWTVTDVLLWVYISGAALLLVRFLIQLILLNSSLKFKKGSAFSFFKILVVDKELPQAETIINHEKVHIRQWHSADVILIELASIISWFNPVVYLYKKEIRHIHEFIADEEAASLLQSKADYAVLLFSNTMGIDPHHLSNNFFNHSLLKRRIIMLNKNKSRRIGLLKYGFSAPLFAAMLVFSSATVKKETPAFIGEAENLISPFTNNSKLPVETGTMSEPVITAKHKDISPTEKPTLNPGTAEVQSKGEDFNKLKQHISKTLKYPASARENNITGYVVVNFTVLNKKITKVEIAKGLQKDLDDEILRSLNLFTDPVDSEDDNYLIAVNIIKSGVKPEPGSMRDLLSKKNFLGLVMVLVNDTGEPKIGYTSTISAAEVLPVFPGGMKAWGEYLSQTLKYPDEAKKHGIEGKVIVSFIVKKDGSLSDLKVLRGIGGGADEEALRALNESPGWKPGLKDGQPVNVAYTMPILFQLPPKTKN